MSRRCNETAYIRIGAVVKTGSGWCTYYGVQRSGFYRLLSKGASPAAALHVHLRSNGIKVNEFYMEDVDYEKDPIVKEATAIKTIWDTHFYDITYFYRATSSAGYYVTERGISGAYLNTLRKYGKRIEILREYKKK